MSVEILYLNGTGPQFIILFLHKLNQNVKFDKQEQITRRTYFLSFYFQPSVWNGMEINTF